MQNKINDDSIKSLRKINESGDMVDMTMFFPTPEMIEQDRMLWLERRAAALRAEWLTEIREADIKIIDRIKKI
jgi:hypothetical protein